MYAAKLRNLKTIPTASNCGDAGSAKNKAIEITKNIIKSNKFMFEKTFLIFFSNKSTIKIGRKYIPIPDNKKFKLENEKTIRNWDSIGTIPPQT